MAISKVQSTSTGTGSSPSSTTVAKAYTSNVTAGNFLFAVAGGAANTTCTFSSSGDTWTTIGSFWDTNIGQLVSIGYAANVTGGAKTVTATFGSSTIFKSLIIEEWSGIATASPLDTNTTGQHVPATTTPSDSAMTTTAAGDLILGGMVSDGATISAGTGFTLDIYETTNHYGAEFQVQGSAGSITVVWTQGSSAQAGVISAAFKAAAGGGSITGTVAETQDNNTSSASGVLGYSGTVARTQANNTAAASGTFTPPGISGTAAVTQANNTSAANGVLGYAGTLARTQANNTAAGSGVLSYSGTVAVTEANNTATASGTVSNPGSNTGTVAVTQANNVAAAAGKLGYAGTVARTQANNTSAASGVTFIPVTGSLAEIQAANVCVALGIITGPGVPVPPFTVTASDQPATSVTSSDGPTITVTSSDRPAVTVH